ncbi:CDP-2,3-bis-(O-geranylgeranyl)-sn-glycerol synthase [Candidatus Woesearchaeota archaeon]|nr:CDP-2,3-bis-(O-geranylgeranyl)-sn-glycerol synthase [Candidatus Woesearchaeota archaeon]
MVSIFLLLGQAIWFILPAYAANMAPVLAKKLFPAFAIPIDLGYCYEGTSLFGEHKTYRGLIAGMVAGTAMFLVQKYLYVYPFFQKLSIVDYHSVSLWLGFLMGFGALAGDLLKSFFKRRKHLEPGAAWFPYDQLDYPVGALVFSAFLVIPHISIVVIILILTPMLSTMVNFLAYLLGLKEVQW